MMAALINSAMAELRCQAPLNIRTEWQKPACRKDTPHWFVSTGTHRALISFKVFPAILFSRFADEAAFARMRTMPGYRRRNTRKRSSSATVASCFPSRADSCIQDGMSVVSSRRNNSRFEIASQTRAGVIRTHRDDAPAVRAESAAAVTLSQTAPRAGLCSAPVAGSSSAAHRSTILPRTPPSGRKNTLDTPDS